MKKKRFLLTNKIGLWDVLSNANRIGSLDSNILNEDFNDFNQLLIDYPNLKVLIFNGQKPAEYFFKMHSNLTDGFEYEILPSTSSANTTKTFYSKLKEWEDAFKKYSG